VPKWKRAGPTPDVELADAVDRLLDTLKTRYSTGALSVEDVGRAHSSLVAGSLVESEDYRRAWLVACFKQGHPRQLQRALGRFVDAGVLVRLPTKSELSGWLSRPRWGAYRVAAELAVACGWEGARDVPSEQTRFRVAWSRAHAHFADGDDSDAGPDSDE